MMGLLLVVLIGGALIWMLMPRNPAVRVGAVLRWLGSTWDGLGCRRQRATLFAQHRLRFLRRRRRGGSCGGDATAVKASGDRIRQRAASRVRRPPRDKRRVPAGAGARGGLPDFSRRAPECRRDVGRARRRPFCITSSISGSPGWLSVSTDRPSPAMRPSAPKRRQTCLRPGQVSLPAERLRRGRPAYSWSL